MENLPLEIKSLIASFADDPSRRALRLANLQWFNITQYDNFTYKVDKTKIDLFYSFLKRLGHKYNFPIGLTLMNLERPTITDYEEIARITQLTKLLSPRANRNRLGAIEDLAPLTNLTNLREVEPMPFEIIRYFTNLHKIHFYFKLAPFQLDLKQFSKLDSISWSNMSMDQLKLIPYPHNITRMLFNSVFSNFSDNLKPFVNLKELEFKTYAKQKYDQLCCLPNLERLSLLTVEIGNLSELHPCPKLTYFSAEWSVVDCYGLATLTSLKVLKLVLPQLTPEDESIFLTALTNLEELEMATQFNSGSIFSTKLTAIVAKIGCSLDNPRLTSLESIVMDSKVWQNNMNGLTNLIHVTHLVLTDCTSEVLPMISKHLTKLKSLEIHIFGELVESDILHVSKLTALERLKLHGNEYNFSRVLTTELNYCLQMRYLNLDGPISDELLKVAANMANLQELHLRDCSLISHDGIALLTGLNQLTFLYMSKVGQDVTGVTFAPLTTLKTLDVFGTLTIRNRNGVSIL